MPNIKCFMNNCKRRIATSSKRNRLGQVSLWPLYQSFVGSYCEENHSQKSVCQSCYLKIRSQIKDEESKNFKRKTASDEQTIPLSPLRTRSKRTCRTELQVSPTVNDSLFISLPEEPQFGTSRQSHVVPSLEDHDNGTYSDYEDEQMHPPESQAGVGLQDLHSQSTDQESQMSIVSNSSSVSSKVRRLTDIKSVVSTQKACFICRNGKGRKRIPKQALTQVWMEKSILIPHENRCCTSHLSQKYFTEEAMALITSTKNGVLMTDGELCTWIFQLRQHSKSGSENRRRYNFDELRDVTEEDYHNLVGFSKLDFDYLVKEVADYVHTMSIMKTSPLSNA